MVWRGRRAMAQKATITTVMHSSAARIGPEIAYPAMPQPIANSDCSMASTPGARPSAALKRIRT